MKYFTVLSTSFLFNVLFSATFSLEVPSVARNEASTSHTNLNESFSLPNSDRWTWSNGESACVGGDEYACIDWNFGSERMVSAAGSYETNVHFGVGSYERPKNMGKCYEFWITSSPSKFVLQVVNEGPDVENNQIDMQIGGGGVGLHNACTEDQNNPGSGVTESSSLPMYSGPFSWWGERFGGWNSESECDNLPACPVPGCSEPEDLRGMCRRAWEWGARINGNADITYIKRIKCPKQLYEITGLRLLSDDTHFDLEERTNLKLTSMMDCCRPSAGFGPNIREPVDPDWPSVRPCSRDGYFRLGNRGGEQKNYTGINKDKG